MDVGRIEAVLTAKFDKDPFDKYERAINGAQSEARRPVTAELRADYNGKDFQRFDKETGQARAQARRPIRQEIKTDYDETGMRRYRDAQGRLRDERGRYIAQDSAMDRSNKRTGAGFTALASNAKFLAGGAAIGGLTIAFRGMYQEQAEAQAATAQLRAVLTSMGTAAGVTEGHMNKLAQAIGKKAAIDDEAVVSSGALMLTFGKVRNEAGKNNQIFDRSIQASVDLSRAFGKDLQGSTIMLGKALNDPIKGLTAMSRVGVSFTEGQKEQVKAMVASGDTLGAQKLILSELERQVGGSAEAYGKTLPGAVDRAGLAFKDFLEIAGEKVAPAVSAAADVIEGLFDGSLFRSGKAAGFGPIIDGFKELGAAVKPLVKEIGKAFSDIFGGGQGAGFKRDLREIGKALGDTLSFMAAVVRRVVPAISGWFRGVLTVIGGIVKIVGGILRGDWGRVWDGAKMVVSGALRAIWSLVRGITAPIREVLSRLFAPVAGWFRSAWNTARSAVQSGVRAVVNAVQAVVGAARSASRAVGRAITGGFDAVRNVAGDVRGFIGRAIDGVRSLAGRAGSAAASVGRAIINGIGNGLRSAGGFLSNVGRGIADWINANTPFGNTIPIGPVKVRLPALAQGGRVGPGMRGAQLFVAGEGGKDEWVISQEGDRRQNVNWAMEALETLTGRQVLFAKKGKKITRVNPLTGNKEKKSAAQWKKVDRQAKNLVSGAQSLATNPGSTDAGSSLAVAQTDDNIIDETISNALTGWAKEAWGGQLRALRQRLQYLWGQYAAKLKAITKAEKDYKGKNKVRRTQAAKNLPGLYEKATGFRSDAGGVYRQIVDILTPPDAGGGDGGGIGGDDGTPPETVTPPSPEEVARLAREQLATFATNRASLFSSFGQNFIGVGGTLTPLTQAAGFRYFGGGQADGGVLGASGGFGNAGMTGAGRGPASNAGAGGVIITNNYAAPPPDPHTWSRGLAWEVKTAVS